MPTGYTANVTKDTTLEQFAWTCARAFGALIEMRDDPNDAPIPRTLEPSTHYRDALKDAQAELIEVQGWTEQDARDDQAKALAAASALTERLNAESAEKRKAYDRMLTLVAAWEPPSPDHVEMKKFMTEQLKVSRDFDCHDYTEKQKPILTSAAWKAKRVAEVAERVSRYTDEWQKEQDRTAGRNRWLEQLRESLNTATNVVA